MSATTAFLPIPTSVFYAEAFVQRKNIDAVTTRAAGDFNHVSDASSQWEGNASRIGPSLCALQARSWMEGLTAVLAIYVPNALLNGPSTVHYGVILPTNGVR
jgi:hypothetical protein